MRKMDCYRSSSFKLSVSLKMKNLPIFFNLYCKDGVPSYLKIIMNYQYFEQYKTFNT